MCAGNLKTDGAIVNPLGTAMQSRLVHMTIMADIKAWTEWANTAGIDYRIITYLNSVPDNLHNFDSKHNDVTFACPRTWEFLSRLVKDVPSESLHIKFPLYAGTISGGVASEFVNYTQVYAQIPTYQDIVHNPTGTKVPTDPAQQFAIAYMIAAQLTLTDTKPVMQYIDKLPLEFQTITLQNAIQKNKKIIEEEAVEDWMDKHGSTLR